MENIMVAVITSVAAVVTAIVSAISANINSKSSKIIKRQNELLEKSKLYTDQNDEKILEKIKEMNSNISADIKNLQISECKNYLVSMIDRIENGDKLGEAAKQLFYEKYDLYNKLGQNSYLNASIEELKIKRKV